MQVNINTNVFKVNTYPDENKLNEIEFTEDFNELADILARVLNTWNDVQCRNTAIIKADKTAALKLKAMAEILINCSDKAIENN